MFLVLVFADSPARREDYSRYAKYGAEIMFHSSFVIQDGLNIICGAKSHSGLDRYCQVQSTLDISKLKGASETLRDTIAPPDRPLQELESIIKDILSSFERKWSDFYDLDLILKATGGQKM